MSSPAGVEGLVSIVMPFLNPGRFLGEAIQSVLAQTYPAWELRLVDDGTTDGSAAVAAAFAARDPGRIHLLAHPDGRTHGASASRNLGLAGTRGEFVALLDADDVWLPENLEQQVRRLRAAPEAGALYSRTMYWYSWSGGRDHTPRLRVPADRLIPAPELLAHCVRGTAPVPCTCSILIRRRALDAVGGFEERFPALYDDQALYAKLFAAHSVLPVDGCWSRYRRHPESMTGTAGRERVRDSRLAYLTWLGEYVQREPPIAAALAPTLERELWRCRHPVGDWLLDQVAFLRRRLSRGPSD